MRGAIESKEDLRIYHKVPMRQVTHPLEEEGVMVFLPSSPLPLLSQTRSISYSKMRHVDHNHRQQAPKHTHIHTHKHTQNKAQTHKGSNWRQQWLFNTPFGEPGLKKHPPKAAFIGSLLKIYPSTPAIVSSLSLHLYLHHTQTRQREIEKHRHRQQR